MYHGRISPLAYLYCAPDIAGCDHIDLQSRDIRGLAIAERTSDVWLKDVIGARRAAAQMGFGRCSDHVTGLGEQSFGRLCNLLPVLKGAGGVIANDQIPAVPHRQTRLDEELTDIPCKRRHAGGFLSIGRIAAEHEAVIFDRRPAAGSGDQDRLEISSSDFPVPRSDISPRRVETFLVASHMVD